MNALQFWAARWGLPDSALRELRSAMIGSDLTDYLPPGVPRAPQNETDVSAIERLKCARQGGRLWRNNVGACTTDTGSFVRYGLANESKRMNKEIKSSDLIGLRPVVVTPEMVGRTIGQFVARESKRPGWKFTGTEREVAQLRFIELVNALGGDAKFTAGP